MGKGKSPRKPGPVGTTKGPKSKALSSKQSPPNCVNRKEKKGGQRKFRKPVGGCQNLGLMEIITPKEPLNPVCV